MVNPSAMESRYRDRPESNSRQNFARFTGTRVTRVNSRVPEKKRPVILCIIYMHRFDTKQLVVKMKVEILTVNDRWSRFL